MGYSRFTIDFEGKQIEIGLSPTLLAEWSVHTSLGEGDMLEAIGRAIIANHDYGKPLESEYLYTTENADTTLERMLDWIKRNRP